MNNSVFGDFLNDSRDAEEPIASGKVFQSGHSSRESASADGGSNGPRCRPTAYRSRFLLSSLRTITRTFLQCNLFAIGEHQSEGAEETFHNAWHCRGRYICTGVLFVILVSVFYM